MGATAMTKTRDNHYVPQWHQKGFMDEKDNLLCHLKRRIIPLPNGDSKTVCSKKWCTPTQRFYEKDLYSTFLGTEVNDEVEKKLFGPIDDNGSKAVRAFLTDDQYKWHLNFEKLFLYLDAQKLRTPKGLDWVRTKYPSLSQLQLMTEMQALRSIHCTIWAEGVRELVSADESEVKFIVSDHPVTIYNYSCPPSSVLCEYPSDPDISLKGTQTIFPLDKNRCLILTNLEYAQDPDNVNPLEQRGNATRFRRSMVNTIEFINTRKLTEGEVKAINFIIKSRSRDSVAAGREDWLYPENDIRGDWEGFSKVLMPPASELYKFGGEIYAKFEDGTVHYQDALGRSTPQHDFLEKSVDENKIGRNDSCGCGSGRKYKNCCRGVPADLRVSWDIASIRERNLAFCSCIRDILGLDKGKTWLDVRRELSDDQISRIYGFYSILWPRETDIYSLLPKSDGKFRGLYTGLLDVRVIGVNALPMASLFDEFLIETPITNPNNVKPEFSPVKSPGCYKYQALKDFLFILEMEPYIGYGLVNLIPDPSEFDLHLMREMMGMATDRSRFERNICESDISLQFRLSAEDLLNSIAMMPRDSKVHILMKEFGVSEKIAESTIDELEASAEASPLVMLQRMNAGEGGQFIQFRMGPNYEMALLIAQVTGSVLVTDSESRFKELSLAQHRDRGIVRYPWDSVTSQLNFLPIDHRLVEEYRKSQQQFSTYRRVLKSFDGMVLNNERGDEGLRRLSGEIAGLNDQLGKNDDEDVLVREFRMLSPEGGFYDSNVQRLLVRSSCTRYDNQVRSVFGIGNWGS